MKAAVIGGGISGVAAAYVLAEAGVQVVLYEKEDNIGGHAKTVTFEGVDVDLDFMGFNGVTNPNMIEFFESLGVDMKPSDVSFSVSLDEGRGYEWSSNGLSGLFSQKKNVMNPYFWQMVREIVKFKGDVLSYLEVLENNPDSDRNETLGQFVKSRGYSELFQKIYLIPVCSSFWFGSSKEVMNSSAFSVLKFCRNHPALQIFGGPQRLTVTNHSQTYVRKNDNIQHQVKEVLEGRGCQIKTNCKVQSVLTTGKGCTVVCSNGSEDNYDGCIIAVHAPETQRILGNQATFDERRILGAFQYTKSDIYLHHDISFMPKNSAAWSAWNFLGGTESRGCLTYWLNVVQNLGKTNLPFLGTLNPSRTPNHTLVKWSASHPVPSVAASKASLELHNIQGKRGFWFCGAYQGFGFHDDGLKVGMIAAHGMIGKQCALLENPKHMAVPSLVETGARHFVCGFLKNYITTGTLILLEEGGSVFSFEGSQEKSPLKVILKIHNPQFYWKVMTEADLGFADAYVDGDYSLVDTEKGLLNLFEIFIANSSKSSSKRGWWRLLSVASGATSAKYVIKHLLRKNTLTQSRRNIADHYNLSNELFALFLDETITYSCAIFKAADEDLKVAQERKHALLVKKARVEKHHHVLEIGCGWGYFAIMVVKQTGCKYTGITLSKEQLKYCEMKVKEVGLQDNIKFLLCDYRQLPANLKFDRILSSEMIEHVGHEYMEEFFRCCESALAEDGMLVLQFIAIVDQMYDKVRKTHGFLKEFIFPGGVFPCVSSVTTAMASGSNLCVEHLENIGPNYYQTLRCWRKNFMERQREVLELGLDGRFIRMWEYYLDYCAAAFNVSILKDYQVVYSRPGNAAFHPYESFPAA